MYISPHFSKATRAAERGCEKSAISGTAARDGVYCFNHRGDHNGCHSQEEQHWAASDSPNDAYCGSVGMFHWCYFFFKKKTALKKITFLEDQSLVARKVNIKCRANSNYEQRHIQIHLYPSFELQLVPGGGVYSRALKAKKL